MEFPSLPRASGSGREDHESQRRGNYQSPVPAGGGSHGTVLPSEHSQTSRSGYGGGPGKTLLFAVPSLVTVTCCRFVCLPTVML